MKTMWGLVLALVLTGTAAADLSYTTFSGAIVDARGMLSRTVVWRSNDTPNQARARDEVDGMQLKTYMEEHPLDWWRFRIQGGEPFVLGPDTPFVLTLPNGDKVYSVAIVLTESIAECEVFLVHEKMCVIDPASNRYARAGDGTIAVFVGFPLGAFNAKHGRDWAVPSAAPVKLEVQE